MVAFLSERKKTRFLFVLMSCKIVMINFIHRYACIVYMVNGDGDGDEML